jgi:hypothetical protein
LDQLVKCEGPFFAGNADRCEALQFGGCDSRATVVWLVSCSRVEIYRPCSEHRDEACRTCDELIPFAERKREPTMLAAAACWSHSGLGKRQRSRLRAHGLLRLRGVTMWRVEQVPSTVAELQTIQRDRDRGAPVRKQRRKATA